MPATTAINGIRYALLTDPANAKTLSQNLAADADDTCVPRYASSNARNAAIPFPGDGSLAYTTDSKILWVYRSQLARWTWFSSIQSVSTADQGQTSTTAYATYTSMPAIPIEANREYDFKAQVGFTVASGTDLKVQFLAPSPGYVEYGFIGAPLGNTATLGWQGYVQRLGSASANMSIGVFQGSGSPQVFMLFGRIFNGGTGGNLLFQFGQNTSSVNTAFVLIGSKIELFAAV